MREQNWKNLDSQKIQEYMSYYNSYYGADFQPGQGLDEITDMISRYSLHGTWVDLGGGTSTFIWLPAFEKITEAHSIDKYAESSYVHEYVRRLSPSGCYSHILNRYGRSICEMKRIPITYSQLDLLSDFAADEKYDNVSQFGLLGLCRSKQEYIKRLGMLSRFMGNRSIFFGSNWELGFFDGICKSERIFKLIFRYGAN